MTRFFNVPSLTALFICSSLSAISTQVLAATVNISENLIVSEINDKSVDNGFIGQQSSFDLNQGNNVLILRYKDVFEDLDFAAERVVESQEFVVKFTIEDQKQLELGTTKINSLAAAEKFSKSPKLQLKDGHANQLNLTLEQVSVYKLAKQVDIAVNSLASQQKIQINNSPSAAAIVTTEKSKETTIQISPLSMLKYWWQNASTDEKQRFKQYTKGN